MIEIIKELKIEVSKPNIFQADVAKQYDMNTRFIKATFVDGSDVIYIPADTTVKAIINAQRADGQSKGFDGVVNEDGTVTVPLHSWMLETEGTVICDISIIDTAADDNKKLTTTAFTLLVEKAAYGGDGITNDPQYDVLVSLIENCYSASEVAQEALEKSNEANSKYDACVEATVRANEAADTLDATKEEIEKGGFITGIKEKNKGDILGFWVGTSKEYESLPEPPENCYVIITDDKTLVDILDKLDSLQSTCERYNKILWTGDLSYDVSASETKDANVSVKVPGISDYNIIMVDGYMYHKEALQAGIVFQSITSFRASSQSIDFEVFDTRTISLSSDDTISLFRNESGRHGSQMWTRIGITDQSSNGVSVMSQFGIKEIIGVM